MSPQLARVLRRWVNSILLLAVLLLVLQAARIPLTAFAFLGGALAIGVGFGAQNVIKNLISGVIILFERQIRVGDIVSIGGTAGTVVDRGLRATTVRGFDGIDAIVPNSNLLENQISNWSGGSPECGAPCRRRGLRQRRAQGGRQVIADCAAAHTSVLKDPAPEVLFSDFGNDDLALRCCTGRDWAACAAGRRVDSDLRFAIARRPARRRHRHRLPAARRAPGRGRPAARGTQRRARRDAVAAAAAGAADLKPGPASGDGRWGSGPQ